MTTSTERLRKLLDERGVKYEEEYKYFGHYITWGENDCCSFAEFPTGAVLRIWDCTPEQAIAATLGNGECEDTSTQDGRFICSRCGCKVWEDAIDNGMLNYCPDCGLAVSR